MQTEKQLQTYLRTKALGAGISFDKLESKSRRGFPDCVLIYNGGVVFVEVKTPAGTGRLSALQRHVIADLRNHGAVVMVIDSPEGVDLLIQTMLDLYA